MTNNDVLRRLRYLLGLNDNEMSGIFALENYRVAPETVASYLKKEEEEEYREMDDSTLGFFLDGLITKNRGKREAKPGQSAERRIVPRNNNERLKKLRIAFNLQEEAMCEVFLLGGFPVNKSELSAFFRKKDHRNYQLLGDQGFRKFMAGLLAYSKGEKTG